jgi:DNA-binding Lrp family transcriptional regulator
MSKEKIVLDGLDKCIMHHICEGIHSHANLAEMCNVTRGTVYRRLSRLENMHVISRKIAAIPNFEMLNLSAICIGISISQEDEDKAIDLLRNLSQIKFLWKTYGTHNLIIIAICNKGEEGELINKLREILAKTKIAHHTADVSIGFSWQKVDITPF